LYHAEYEFSTGNMIC